jgi:hypothetical protein
MPLLFAGREFMRFFKGFYVYEFYLIYLRQRQSETYAPSALRLAQFFIQLSQQEKIDQDRSKRFRRRAFVVLKEALAFYLLSEADTAGYAHYGIVNEYLESLRSPEDSSVICNGTSPTNFCQKIAMTPSILCRFCLQPMIRIDY